MTDLPIIQILTYAFTLWFGLYLIARSHDKPGLRFAGLGLLAYGMGIGLDALAGVEADVMRWRLPLLFLPPTFWLGATLYLLPDMPINRRWEGVLLLEATLTYIIGVIVDFSGARGVVYVLFVGVSIVLLLVALAYIWRRRETLPGNTALPIIITIFFVLGVGVIILPEIGIAPDLLYWAIGLDIVLLSYLIVVLDAYDAGEALLPDFVRSMGAAGIVALIFGGQVVLVMAITGGLTVPLLLLLLITIATAIAMQTFANQLETLLDKLLLARFPRLQAERARLRAIASNLPRVDESLDLLNMSDAQFARLTRRALSNLSDVQKLSASPLINLPIIDARLHDSAPNTLERAAELRALLTESIERLKPRGDDSFGTTDEWRYYNALYFPYVIGLKPYSRRDMHNGLTPDAQAALDWLRTYIPERTLYNWQNAAAKLVAQDLREQMVVGS